MKKILCTEEVRAVKQVRESVGDASQGLPEEIFELASSIVPMVNVDLFIQDGFGRILMIWREDEICGCGWHIPGGIIRFKETIEDRIQKTALNELGVRIKFDPKPMAVNEFILPQDVRGHFVSFLYRCFPMEGFPELPEADPVKSYQAGTMCWHKVCPGQWVKGQKETYGDLFQPSFPLDHAGLASAAQKMKSGDCTIVFDIDGVIAEFDPSLKYDQAKPAQNIIRIINQLYDYGNQIILFTARGSATGIDWSQMTEKQMEAWGVKYHQLKFGKPAATFYVDDKNLSLLELALLAESMGIPLPKASTK